MKAMSPTPALLTECRYWRLSDERCNWPNTLRAQREGSN